MGAPHNPTQKGANPRPCLVKKAMLLVAQVRMHPRTIEQPLRLFCLCMGFCQRLLERLFAVARSPRLRNQCGHSPRRLSDGRPQARLLLLRKLPGPLANVLRLHLRTLVDLRIPERIARSHFPVVIGL